MGQSISALRYVERSNPNNKYTISSELGSGSYGKVYKVKDRHTGDVAAAKVAQLESKQQLSEFEEELQILSTRHHMGVTAFFGAFFNTDNTLWIVLELCEGGSLSDIMVKTGQPITEDPLRCICCQTLTALSFLHRNRVIHRDINASNIMVSATGLIKIGDFGVSAVLRSDSERRSTFIGSPNWMAPEMVACETDRSRTYTSKVDVWSFGCTVIELAERKPPFSDLHPVKVLLRINTGAPPTLASPDDWSPDLAMFLSSCLVKDTKNRPAAAELVSHPFCLNRLDREPIVNLVKSVGAAS